jgi:hypothetical protein
VLVVRIVKAALVAAIPVVALIVSLAPAFAREDGSLAVTISIDGAIGPASASYVKDALVKAGERHAEIVVVRLNTQGGLNTSMREIIADVLASRVPLVGYVAPSGAHAASAGTYILYATHVAAMAPGTNIGAATPVAIGGPIPSLPEAAPDKDGKDTKDSEHQPKPKDAMTAKVTNDAVALIRSLAELRGRNTDWAEKAVREAATLSANEAFVDLLKERPEFGHVEPRRSAAVDAEIAAGDLAAKGQALQIEETPCPLQIGQRVGVGCGKPLELAARRDLEFERFHELWIMPLQDAERRRDVARDIVDDLASGHPSAPEETPPCRQTARHRSHAGPPRCAARATRQGAACPRCKPRPAGSASPL